MRSQIGSRNIRVGRKCRRRSSAGAAERSSAFSTATFRSPLGQLNLTLEIGHPGIGHLLATRRAVGSRDRLIKNIPLVLFFETPSQCLNQLAAVVTVRHDD